MFQENTGELVIPGKKSLQLVDIPGHARIRDSILERYAGRANITLVLRIRTSIRTFWSVSDLYWYEYTQKTIFACVKIRDAPDIRPDNPAFFYIRFPAGYQIALPDIQ
jgi:hypothetical protein